MGIFGKTLANSGSLIGILTGGSLSGACIYWSVDGIFKEIEDLKKKLAEEKKTRRNLLSSHLKLKNFQREIRKVLKVEEGKEEPVFDESFDIQEWLKKQNNSLSK